MSANKEAMHAEYLQVRKARGGTAAHFRKAAAAFAKMPSSVHWRALKRAMMYHQCNSPGGSTIGQVLPTFKDEE